MPHQSDTVRFQGVPKLFEARNRKDLPIGSLGFLEDSTFPATSTGDTRARFYELELPENYFFVLESFHLDMESGDENIAVTTGYFRQDMTLLQNTAASGAVDLYYPGIMTVNVTSGSGDRRKSMILGDQGEIPSPAFQGPHTIVVPGLVPATLNPPTIMLDSPGENLAYDVHISVTYAMFTSEQFNLGVAHRYARAR